MKLTQPLLTLLFIIVSLTSNAQGWIKRKNLPQGLETATAASANGYGFLTSGGGSGHYRYDNTNNTWNFVAPLPGNSRISAVSSTINNKIYYGLGYCEYTYNVAHHKELYEYDVTNNTWSQKTSFPGNQRWLWAYFTANDKMYVTLGKGPINSSIGYCTDTWEYNPVTNAWSLKDSFPGGREGPAFFSFNNKGYVISQRSGGSNVSELWQYEPGINKWISKADCPDPDRLGVAFSTDSFGYFLTTKSAFWEYNPYTDTWKKLRDFPGPKRHVATSFSLGKLGYITTGQHVNQQNQIYALNDLWEYNRQCPADIINELSVTGHKELYCLDTLYLDSINAYTVNHANTDYKWLSSADGTNYNLIQGNTSALLYNQSLTQTTYFKRVVTLNVGCLDTSQPVQIKIENIRKPVIDTLTLTKVCKGDTVVLQCNSIYKKRWSNGDTSKIIRIGDKSDKYFVVATNKECFMFSDTIEVLVHTPPVTTYGAPTTGGYGFVAISATGASYQWYKADGTLLPAETKSTFYPADSGFFYAVVIDSNGCSTKMNNIYSTYTPPVSINITQHSLFSIYPNPFNGNVIVNNSSFNTDYNIIDIFGRVLITGTFLYGKNIVSTEQLVAGQYVLNIVAQNGFTYKYKLTKL